MKVVVVGFKVTEENSVYYSKWQARDGGPIEKEYLAHALGNDLMRCIEKGADFVSVRFTH